MRRRIRMRVGLMGAILLMGGCGWLAYRAIQQENLNRQLISAIKQNTFEHSRTQEVLACLQHGADPNTRDEPYQATFSWNRLLILFGWRKAPAVSKQPALLLALEGDLKSATDCFDHQTDPGIVKLLLHYKANVNVKDRYGRTPLIAAFSPVPSALKQGMVITFPNAECELALIAAGADVDACDEYGYTVLMGNGWFYSSGNDPVESALLRRGANVNAQTPEGMTALICRAQIGNESVCQLLLDRGAEINHADKYGSTALTAAAGSGNRHLVDMLLQRGAHVNANAGQSGTALMRAASGMHNASGSVSIAAENYCAIGRTLLQHGAIVDARDKEGETALIHAAEAGNIPLVNTLLQQGANVNANRDHGRTALMAAASGGHRAILRILLQHGAVIGSRDETDWTALTHAAFSESEHSKICVQLLLDRGAKIPGKDKQGDSLYSMLKDRGDAKSLAILRILKAHGMKAK